MVLLIGALAVTFVVYCCLIVGAIPFRTDANRLADGAEPKNIETVPAGDGVFHIFV